MQQFDVIVLGAGAAGMMCAIEAGKRGRRVLVLDHAKAAGEKIRISGGGRCNFTNVHTAPQNFISANPHFCKSALGRYRPADFIELVEHYGVTWHEKTLGQLFCDESARQIVDLLLAEMETHGVELWLEATVSRVTRNPGGFEVRADADKVLQCSSLVVATGGKSIPKMGATPFGYDLARQFNVPIIETRPALVPLTFEIGLLERYKPLSGVALDVAVTCGKVRFEEAMLFTHRGLSGPAILQISSYWREGDEIEIDMAPHVDLYEALRQARAANGRHAVATVLGRHIPRRLADHILNDLHIGATIGETSDKGFRNIADAVKRWRVKPVGSEGYRTAEVTLGGVDTKALESKTMEAKEVPGLYFIGEVVDVTGWLGGYNFQWAWASGWAAGQVV